MKKEVILKSINEMPNEFELEDLFEKLMFIEKVQTGLNDMKENKVLTHDSVIDKLKEKWLK